MIKRSLFTAICIILICSIQLRANMPQYISMKKKYEINLPQFDVCIPMPANASFELPIMLGDSIMIGISEQTVFCFPLSILNNPDKYAFRFLSSADDDKSYPLTLNILPHPQEFDPIKALEDEKKESYFAKDLKSIKIGLGQTLSYSVKINSENLAVHLFYKDGYVFLFRYNENCDVSQIKRYQDIIGSVKEKNLYMERGKYETRLKAGYYDKERKNRPDPNPETAFHQIKGLIPNTGTLTVDELGISIPVYEDFYYMVYGRRFDISENDNKSNYNVYLTKVDLAKESNIFSGLFMNGQVTYSYNISKYKSGEKYHEQMKKNTAFSKQSKIFIDGIESDVLVYGTDQDASVNAYFNYEDYEYNFAVYGLNINTVNDVDNYFSNIRITIDTPRNTTKQNNKPISSIVKMKKQENEPLDNITLSTPDMSDTFYCDVEAIGLRLYFLGEKEDYYYHFEESKDIPQNNIIIGIPIDDQPISISSVEHNRTTLLIRKAQFTQNVEDMMSNMKRSWKAYPDIKVLKAGVLNIAGNKWGMFIYKNDRAYISMFTTQINGYDIYYTVMGDSESEMYNYCNLVNAFKSLK